MKLHAMRSQGQLDVRLFTKPGCHLCEQAEADLARLRRRYPHTLQKIDISAGSDLQKSYGERIPVLSIAGREYAAPMDYADIERALAQATLSIASTQELTPDGC